ncbi:MAG: hypothetical protein WCK02_02270 [Bacteroidota bacterium]
MFFNLFKSKHQEDYFDIVLYPHSEYDYNRIFNTEHATTFKTEKNIVFKNLDWGISSDEVIKRYVKPTHITNRKLNNTNQRIFFYKLQRKYIMSVIQIHFFDNKLSYITREYKYTHDSQNNEILAEIRKAYNIPNEFNIDSNFAICDSNNNTLKFNTDFSVKLEYITQIK